MKLKTFILLVPLFALVSCNSYGTTVSEEKAYKIAEKIEDNAFQPSTKAFEGKYISEESIDKDEDKRTTNYTINLQIDDSDNTHFELESKSTYDGEIQKTSISFYDVKNSKYGRVVYMKQNQPGSSKTTTRCYSSKYSNSYYSTYTLYKQGVLQQGELYSFLNGAKTLTNMLDAMNGAGLDSNESYKVNYYSKGSDNLTFIVSYKYDTEETYYERVIKGRASMTFDKDLCTKAEIQELTTFGNKNKTKWTASRKKGLEISLPRGWEKVVDNYGSKD